ncbi:aggregation-promoting factor C-terminal-like domain-containing protein [Actinoallomurus acaciae]
MATSAMPPYGPGADPALTPDFEGGHRAPGTGNKRLIRFAAVAAAVAVVGGGGVAWAVTGGSSSSNKDHTTQQVQAQAPPPAPLTDAQRADAEKRRQKELKKRASRAARSQVVRPKLLAKGTPPPKPKPTTPSAGDPVPASEAQRIARSLLPSFGWSPSSQFGCLVNLWNRESGWNVHAANPSGAYGIPQAKPGSKMSSAGPDWQNNATTQIKWGLGYIKDRYSTPCGAWSHSQSSGWY